VPIRSRFASNWELSTARALAAVHFLTEQAGVDPRRVGAVGYGEFRPVADNATPEGRAKNRRIAITILPDELAGADTVPTANPAPPALLNRPKQCRFRAMRLIAFKHLSHEQINSRTNHHARDSVSSGFERWSSEVK